MLEKAVVSPSSANRERSLPTVNPGTGPAIGKIVLGTGVTPGSVIRE